MVARGAFLLVGAFVFFVNNDEPERCHRAKQGASRPHDHAFFAQAHRFPLVESLARRHARMHDGYGIAEATLEARHRLRGKCDFGHEHNGTTSQFERMANRAQIHLGFT